MALFGNRFFLGFLALYLVSLATLVLSGVYLIAEPLFIFAIFGLIMPGAAYFFSRKCPPLKVRVDLTKKELWVTFLYILFVTAYLIWGGEVLNSLVYGLVEKTQWFDFFFTIVKKVLIFVLIPYLLLAKMFGYSWKDFGFVRDFKRAFNSRYLILMAVLFLLFFLVQFFVGQAAQPIFKGEFPFSSLLLGAGLLYPLLVIEVGLVEEFFFRAIVQTRMAVWLKSEVAGVVTMAVIFGLAHAPGIYLRGAEAGTQLGADPGFFPVVAYSIAVISLAGVVFGVIWAKTRNIYVVMLIHAWVDLFPFLPTFIKTFGL